MRLPRSEIRGAILLAHNTELCASAHAEFQFVGIAPAILPLRLSIGEWPLRADPLCTVREMIGEVLRDLYDAVGDALVRKNSDLLSPPLK